jgi:hypothetical protein
MHELKKTYCRSSVRNPLDEFQHNDQRPYHEFDCDALALHPNSSLMHRQQPSRRHEDKELNINRSNDKANENKTHNSTKVFANTYWSNDTQQSTSQLLDLHLSTDI